MTKAENEISFARGHGFDGPRSKAAIVLAPVAVGIAGTLLYIGHARTIWGFLFVLWFVVLDFCLIGLTMFRQARPPIASRVVYCVIALMGGAIGAIEPNRWGGAIPILTMLVAVLAALILEQLAAVARDIVRFISRPS